MKLPHIVAERGISPKIHQKNQLFLKSLAKIIEIIKNSTKNQKNIKYMFKKEKNLMIAKNVTNS